LGFVPYAVVMYVPPLVVCERIAFIEDRRVQYPHASQEVGSQR
jgi:hypothetical protein